MLLLCVGGLDFPPVLIATQAVFHLFSILSSGIDAHNGQDKSILPISISSCSETSDGP